VDSRAFDDDDVGVSQCTERKKAERSPFDPHLTDHSSLSSLKLYSSMSSRLSTRWWYLSQCEHWTKIVPLARA